MDADFIFHYVRSQFIFIGKFVKQIEFEQNYQNSFQLLTRIEIEVLKSLEFINTFSSYPFLIDTFEDNLEGTLKIKAFIEYLDDIVLSLQLYEKKLGEEMRFDLLDPSSHMSENVEEADPFQN